MYSFLRPFERLNSRSVVQSAGGKRMKRVFRLFYYSEKGRKRLYDVLAHYAFRRHSRDCGAFAALLKIAYFHTIFQTDFSNIELFLEFVFFCCVLKDLSFFLTLVYFLWKDFHFFEYITFWESKEKNNNRPFEIKYITILASFVARINISSYRFTADAE